MHHKFKLHFATYIALMLCGAAISAQSVLPACGGFLTSEGGSLSHTLGQVAVSYTEGLFTNMQWRGASLNEGVQQPYTVEEQRNKAGEAFPSALIYPNPTSDGVTLTLDDASEGCTFTLYSIDGSPLLLGTPEGNATRIDMRHLPSGTYILHLSGGGRDGRWKIIKR